MTAHKHAEFLRSIACGDDITKWEVLHDTWGDGCWSTARDHVTGIALHPDDWQVRRKQERNAEKLFSEPVMIYNGHHDVELLKMIPSGALLYLHPADVVHQTTTAQQERKPHTEAEVQVILAADWSLSQDRLENRVRKILGVPAPKETDHG